MALTDDEKLLIQKQIEMAMFAYGELRKLPQFSRMHDTDALDIADVASRVVGTIINAENYVLPTAADDTLGGIKVGSGLSIDSVTGILSVNLGDTFTVDSVSGAIDVNLGNSLITDSVTGAIDVALGEGLTYDDDGAVTIAEEASEEAEE